MPRAAQLSSQVAPTRPPRGLGAGSARRGLASPAPQATEPRGRRWALGPRGPQGRGRPGPGLGGGAGGAPRVTVVAWCCRGRKRGRREPVSGSNPHRPGPCTPPGSPASLPPEPEASFLGPSPTCKENQEKLVPPGRPPASPSKPATVGALERRNGGGAVRLKKEKEGVGGENASDSEVGVPLSQERKRERSGIR